MVRAATAAAAVRPMRRIRKSGKDIAFSLFGLVQAFDQEQDGCVLREFRGQCCGGGHMGIFIARRVRRDKRRDPRAPFRDKIGARGDRKSVVWGKSVSVGVDLGGRVIIKKKKPKKKTRHT